MLGSVKDDILNTEELAWRLLSFMQERYREALRERYSLEESDLEKQPEVPAGTGGGSQELSCEGRRPGTAPKRQKS